MSEKVHSGRSYFLECYSGASRNIPSWKIRYRYQDSIYSDTSFYYPIDVWHSRHILLDNNRRLRFRVIIINKFIEVPDFILKARSLKPERCIWSNWLSEQHHITIVMAHASSHSLDHSLILGWQRGAHRHNSRIWSCRAQASLEVHEDESHVSLRTPSHAHIWVSNVDPLSESLYDIL